MEIEERKLFWGLIVEADKKYEQEVDESFHISHASIAPPTVKKGGSLNSSEYSGIISVYAEDGSGDSFLICNLSFPDAMNQSLDLNFVEGEHISLRADFTPLSSNSIKSKSLPVHLTGYFVPSTDDDDDDFDPEGMDSLMGEYCGGGEAEDSDEEEEEEGKIEELSDDDDETEEESQKSIQKTINNKRDIPIVQKRKAEDAREVINAKKSKKVEIATDGQTVLDKLVAHKKKMEEKSKDSKISPSKKDLKMQDMEDSENDDDDDLDGEEGSDDDLEMEEEDELDDEELDSDEEDMSNDEEELSSEKMDSSEVESSGEKKKPNTKKNANEPISKGKTQQTINVNTKPITKQQQAVPTEKPLSKKEKKALKKAEMSGDKKQQNGVIAAVKNAVTTTPSSPAPNANKQKQQKDKENKTPNKQGGGGTPVKTPRKVIKGGIIVEDTQVGSGQEMTRGKNIGVYYEGRLKSNDKVFDSQLSGKPLKFKLGGGEVIKGWDLGLEGMKVGGKRRLIIPPNMAYGAAGQGSDIPPNSTLVFDVEAKFA